MTGARAALAGSYTPSKSVEHEGNSFRCYFYDVDHDYLSTFGMQLVAGRDFAQELTADVQNSVIINEEVARVLGWQDPVGKVMPGFDKTIIGVVRDYHLMSLHDPVEPVVLALNPEGILIYAFVRISSDAVSTTLAEMEHIWKTIKPDRTFSFSFLDEDVDSQYRTEMRWSRVVWSATGFALFIACLGASALASLAASQRAREISIRKVLGASIGGIVSLFSQDYAKLAGISFLAAGPVSYFVLNRWLDDFAYRIALPTWVFLLGGTLPLLVVLATVCSQVLRAARTNPVDSLRSE